MAAVAKGPDPRGMLLAVVVRHGGTDLVDISGRGLTKRQAADIAGAIKALTMNWLALAKKPVVR